MSGTTDQEQPVPFTAWVDKPKDTDSLIGGENAETTSHMNWKSKKCNDVCFAVLFIAQLAGIVTLAVVNFDFLSFDGAYSMTEVLITFGVAVLVAIMGASVYLHVLRTCPETAVNAAIGLNVALLGMLAIFTLLQGNALMAGLYALGTAGMVFYWWYIQSRIPFTVALIEISIKVLDSNRALFAAAATTIVCQTFFIITWVLAFLGYGQSTKGEDGEMNIAPGMFILFLLSAFWSFETFRYMLYSTSCGVTASWFFTPDMPNATNAAFTRAAFWSFGSICFGGLVIAIIKTIEVLARIALNNRDSDNACAQVMACCALCILSLIEDLIEYMNQFGFAFIAIYGMTYCEACQSAWRLVKDTGFESLFAYDLTNMVMGFGCLLVGLFTFVVIYGYTAYFGSVFMKDNTLTVALIGLVIAVGISYVATMILVGATMTTFIVWAMDPVQIFSNRPEESQSLSKAAELLPSLSISSRHLNGGNAGL